MKLLPDGASCYFCSIAKSSFQSSPGGGHRRPAKADNTSQQQESTRGVPTWWSSGGGRGLHPPRDCEVKMGPARLGWRPRRPARVQPAWLSSPEAASRKRQRDSKLPGPAESSAPSLPPSHPPPPRVSKKIIKRE